MLPIDFREEDTNEKREIDEVGVKLVFRLKSLLKVSDPNKTKHLATVALQYTLLQQPARSSRGLLQNASSRVVNFPTGVCITLEK